MPLTRTEKLEGFYKEIASLTLDHDVINGNACVTANKLGKALSKVDNEWYAYVEPKVEDDEEEEKPTARGWVSKYFKRTPQRFEVMTITGLEGEPDITYYDEFDLYWKARFHAFKNSIFKSHCSILLEDNVDLTVLHCYHRSDKLFFIRKFFNRLIVGMRRKLDVW